MAWLISSIMPTMTGCRTVTVVTRGPSLGRQPRRRGASPLGPVKTDASKHQLRGGGNGEVACKRDSVSDQLPGRSVTIHLCGLPEGVCGALRRHGRTGRPCPLLGLAPGGVYRADDVAVAAGALLPHRFTLTCDQIAVKRTGPSAVSLCCTCPSGHPDLALASTLPCGVPTFLDDAARTAAITRPPHHCRAECTAPGRFDCADRCPKRPAFRDRWGTDRHLGRTGRRSWCTRCVSRWVRVRCRSRSSATASAG